MKDGYQCWFYRFFLICKMSNEIFKVWLNETYKFRIWDIRFTKFKIDFFLIKFNIILSEVFVSDMKQHLKKAGLLLKSEILGKFYTLNLWRQQQSRSLCTIKLFTKVWEILKKAEINLSRKPVCWMNIMSDKEKELETENQWIWRQRSEIVTTWWTRSWSIHITILYRT